MRSNKILFEKIWIICFAALLLSTAACVQFKQASLYDGVEVEAKPPKPKDIALIVEPVIYNDDPTDVWGLEKDSCKEASLSKTEVYSGNSALQVTWNLDAEGCDWAGIGIGWDGYAGKDLSEIMDYVAIQMYVRTQKGRAFGLPMVLTLEDYSGGMGFAYTGNKYFERSAIDEEWQKVVVPLSSFEIEKENLDPSNIKQLQIELQQSGSIYLDDISLIFYEPEPQEIWLEEEVLPDPTVFPIQVLNDSFINNNGWGLITDKCQTIALTDKESSEGEKSLYAKWDNSIEDCKLTAFGVSWNKWHPVDLTSVRQTSAIQFDIKILSENPEKLLMKIGFEVYDRAKYFASLESRFVKDGQFTNDWTKVTIPLSAIPDGLDFTRIKHLYVNLEGAGEVYIDNIQLIPLNSN
jgi:hypothetical protein